MRWLMLMLGQSLSQLLVGGQSLVGGQLLLHLLPGEGLSTSAPPPGAVPLTPTVILVLCVVAGIGTVLMLPGRRDAIFRKIGGVIVVAATAIFAAILIRYFGGDSQSGASKSGVGFYFWVFSAISLFGALRVVTHTRPVYSALYLVLTVFATAGLFLLLYAEFMAVALVLIYAGAILVTYVFVIMLAAEAAGGGSSDESGKLPLMGLLPHDRISREPLAACAVGFAMMGVLLFVIFDKSQAIAAVPGHADVARAIGGATGGTMWGTGAEVSGGDVLSGDIVSGGVQQLGAYLFKSQIVSLELAGLLLTVAMVGAIVISRKKVIVAQNEPPALDAIAGPSIPVDDNPHSIPVYGTTNPRQKAFPEM